MSRNNGSLLVDMPSEEAPAVARALVSAGVDVYELSAERASLEDIFFELTDQGEDASP